MVNGSRMVGNGHAVAQEVSDGRALLAGEQLGPPPIRSAVEIDRAALDELQQSARDDSGMKSNPPAPPNPGHLRASTEPGALHPVSTMTTGHGTAAISVRQLAAQRPTASPTAYISLAACPPAPARRMAEPSTTPPPQPGPRRRFT